MQFVRRVGRISIEHLMEEGHGYFYVGAIYVYHKDVGRSPLTLVVKLSKYSRKWKGCFPHSS
jgi:hypothetical protein